MTRRELVKEMLKELSYEGNLGAMEIFKFYDVASPGQIKDLDRLMKQKKWKPAWRLIQKVTKVNLFGKEFEATIKQTKPAPGETKGGRKKMNPKPAAGKTDAGKEKMNPKKHWEVSPPGWGHTKAEKEKSKPSKPKSKIGGTIAQMKKKKDITNPWALAWWMKDKGYKPHYKPGTDTKYKKYQKKK